MSAPGTFTFNLPSMARWASVAALSFVSITNVQAAAIREGTPGNASYDHVGTEISLNTMFPQKMFLKYSCNLT